VHSGERPFACDEAGCEYKATHQHHLKRHRLVHSGERPFACNEAGCEYKATQAAHLKSHKRTHSMFGGLY
jgi:KRAB domain-containing zinc finger protein